ncbi:MAG: septum formation initiator family protein [Thermodesulfobacteriota bacterium]|nr:septum formation initiator family protein [Thermodesulfobacteriota bacterium]
MGLKHKIGMTVALIGLIGLVGLILYGSNGYFDYVRFKQKKERLVQKNQGTEVENQHLSRKIKRLRDDPVYIEHVAREELGMVAPDEVIYKFRD